MTEPVRVLIVDDSALMRKILSELLSSEPQVEVVGTARNGDEAIAEAVRLRPDVITLDIEMPGRSGLEILPDLLAAHQAAVLMISTHTKEGAAVTLEALERGAVDFLPKPERFQLAQLRDARDLLIGKVLAAYQARPRRRRRADSSGSVGRSSASPAERSQAEFPQAPAAGSAVRCIVIGISTGGPQALGAILPLVASPTPPIVIVQHMPAAFTPVFAERLNRSCALDVKEAEEGDRLITSRILISPGGRHTSITGSATHPRVTILDTPAVSGHKPSIDVLFESAVRLFQAGTLGILMTGMGRDGVAGCKAILAHGGVTYGQDEATSAVYGMNKVAQLEGALSGQFPLDRLPALIRRFSSPG